MTDCIKRHVEGGVLELVIDRPAKRNALLPAMYSALAAGFDDAANGTGIRVVLLRGQPGVFTSGNDIETFLGAGGPVGPDHPVFRFMHALTACPCPVVAAVDGPAIGIGATLLLHCDLVYASPAARIQFPFVRLGLCPEFAASLLLPLRVGRARAAEALLLGEVLECAQAERWGLVNQIVPAEALDAHARERASALAAMPAEAVAASKRLLDASDRAAVAAAMAREQQAFLALLGSETVQAGFRAFLASRASRP